MIIIKTILIFVLGIVLGQSYNKIKQSCGRFSAIMITLFLGFICLAYLNS